MKRTRYETGMSLSVSYRLHGAVREIGDIDVKTCYDTRGHHSAHSISLEEVKWKLSRVHHILQGLRKPLDSVQEVNKAK